MATPGRRKRILIVLILLILFLVVATQSGWLGGGLKLAEQNQPGLYRVTHFDDGDTIVVDMNGSNETIRFIGVDTPETHKPNTPIQCYGPVAATYTKQLIGTQKVRLASDPLDTNRDRYGRLLRYVYLPDGTLVEDKLISGGYGFAYTLFPFTKADQFRSEQEKAKAGKFGLWSACQVTEETGAFHTNPAQ